MKKIFLTSLFALFLLQVMAQQVNIIPQPVEIQQKEGVFNFTPETQILFDTSDEDLAEVVELSHELITATLGFEPVLLDEKKAEPTQNFVVHLNSLVDPDIKIEGYKLHIKNDRIFLNANTPAGVFYGFQTLWQLLTASEGNKLAAVEIVDYPRFAWRGLHLDVSRHFMPAEFIYKYIDYIAMHKMNVFHWHLVDDQGWRIEMEQYPKLTEIGAWRVDRENQHWNSREPARKGEEATYGGF